MLQDDKPYKHAQSTDELAALFTRASGTISVCAGAMRLALERLDYLGALSRENGQVVRDAKKRIESYLLSKL